MIDPILFALGGLVFGYVVSDNNKKQNTLFTMEKLINQNKEFVELNSTLEILNKEIDSKKSNIVELEAMIIQREEEIQRLLQRAEFLRNSGELQKFEQLSQLHKNLKHIKENLNIIQKKHKHRFNIGVLVCLVQELYEELNDRELDILGVQELMEEYSDNNKSSSGGSFGENEVKQEELKPKKNSMFRRD